MRLVSCHEERLSLVHPQVVQQKGHHDSNVPRVFFGEPPHKVLHMKIFRLHLAEHRRRFFMLFIVRAVNIFQVNLFVVRLALYIDRTVLQRRAIL